MSHLPQRKEKNCLNCGTEVLGRYCHNCGQENLEPKETAWHLTNHFFQDITHFDGKFFSSLKRLLFKPGFLSAEYVKGRRASYLNPVRMYLFTSAIFFLIFFSIFRFDETDIKTTIDNKELSELDSTEFAKLTREKYGKAMTKAEFIKKIDTAGGLKITPANYKSKADYDSALKSGRKKHNWFERQLIYKQIELNEKYQHNSKLILVALINKFVHSIPQMLFILLPLFALVLKLLYTRRKDFYYVDHAIFTLHFYIFVFIDMLLIFGVNKIKAWLHWDWLNYIVLVLSLVIFFYLYKAMRIFYKQRRGKTILKYFLLLISVFFITIILFVAFFFLSIFNS